MEFRGEVVCTICLTMWRLRIYENPRSHAGPRVPMCCQSCAVLIVRAKPMIFTGFGRFKTWDEQASYDLVFARFEEHRERSRSLAALRFRTIYTPWCVEFARLMLAKRERELAGV